jgi:pilus assembly protein CpaB
MRVDVLVTGKPPGADDTFTATVLQNVTVLSAGQTVQSDGKSQSMSVPVVTLLVDPLQAESLTLAANEGHIQLVLRNSGDRKVEATARRELRDLYTHGIPADPDPAPKPAPAAAMRSVTPTQHSVPASIPNPPPTPVRAAPAPPAVETVVMIRGSQKTVETFPAEARSHEGSK